MVLCYGKWSYEIYILCMPFSCLHMHIPLILFVFQSAFPRISVSMLVEIIRIVEIDIFLHVDSYSLNLVALVFEISGFPLYYLSKRSDFVFILFLTGGWQFYLCMISHCVLIQFDAIDLFVFHNSDLNDDRWLNFSLIISFLLPFSIGIMQGTSSWWSLPHANFLCLHTDLKYYSVGLTHRVQLNKW